jgi:thiol peroxidase
MIFWLVMAAAVIGLATAGNAAEVTMKGKPIELAGKSVAVGDQAPDFTALDADFQPVSLGDFRGRRVLISAVPSLDTPVCSLQTKRFNSELDGLPDDLVVLTISMDLPFAQRRFCGSEDIQGMVVVSDSARREFGKAYGVLIEERGLLARSIFLVDAGGKIEYVQVVPEITHEPDYEAALAAVRGPER